MQINIINKSKNDLPKYQTSGAVGLDLCSNIDYILKPQEIKIIPTGLFVEIPENYEAQIRPRSGLALKAITVLNSPGTIDSDYRGEIGIILINLGTENYTVKIGDRIAQMVVCPIKKIEWNNVLFLNETPRNTGGFGSTDKNINNGK